MRPRCPRRGLSPEASPSHGGGTRCRELPTRGIRADFWVTVRSLEGVSVAPGSSWWPSSGSLGTSAQLRSERAYGPPVRRALANAPGRGRGLVSPTFFLKGLLLTSQLLIIDGQQLRSYPATVMDEIQKFLGVTPHYNYSQALT